MCVNKVYLNVIGVKFIGNYSSKLLAYCSHVSNEIRIVDLETQEEYDRFIGAKIPGAQSKLPKFLL